jgi:hypothetical protein
MILTREETAFLEAYCHEGTEAPFGGPATDAMTSIGAGSGDTLNLRWAYLRENPPTGPVIGKRSDGTVRIPWPNREAMIRRDGEIQLVREQIQSTRSRNFASA